MKNLKLKHGIRGAIKGFVIGGTISTVIGAMNFKGSTHFPFIKDDVQVYNCQSTEYYIDGVVDGPNDVEKRELEERLVAKYDYEKNLKDIELRTYSPWIEDSRRITYRREESKHKLEKVSEEMKKEYLQLFEDGKMDDIIEKHWENTRRNIWHSSVTESSPLSIPKEELENKRYSAYLTINNIDKGTEPMFRKQTTEENYWDNVIAAGAIGFLALFGMSDGILFPDDKEEKLLAKKEARQLKKKLKLEKK